ncbi:MAG: hypothetical protein M0T74_01335 [Desulfitobacterium hafniense]|nr:hypothetical protein [Desulfitobacterium hafniense]
MQAELRYRRSDVRSQTKLRTKLLDASCRMPSKFAIPGSVVGERNPPLEAFVLERSNLSVSLVRAAYRVTGVKQNPGDIH